MQTAGSSERGISSASPRYGGGQRLGLVRANSNPTSAGQVEFHGLETRDIVQPAIPDIADTVTI